MPKNDTPGVEVTITYDDCKSLSHVLLCYGEPSGCRLDDETNESVCGEGECALLAAYKAGATTARAEAEAKDAEIARLREALEGVATFLETAPLESGVCCCGDPIEGHGYHSGHSPVDQASYTAMLWAKDIRAALRASEGGADGQ